MEETPIYITIIAENTNDILKRTDDNVVKELFEKIGFVENSYVSHFGCSKTYHDIDFGSHYTYHNHSFLIVGNLKDPKFAGLYKILNETLNEIPFTIEKYTFVLKKLQDVQNKQK